MAPVNDPILIDGREWLFADGTRLPLIAGGEGDSDPKPEPPDPKPDPKPEPKPEPDPGELGDAGKRALDAEREARKAAERKLRDAEKDRDRLKQQNETDQEKAIREASEAVRGEERQKAHDRILKAEIKARAGTKLADPGDAVRLLDLSEFPVSDDGEVDEEKIDKAIDKLLERKPYLKADAGGATPPGSKPSVDGGPRPKNDDKQYNIAGRLERIQQRTGIK